MLTIRPYLPDDLEILGELVLRAEDIEEITASSDVPPQKLLVDSVLVSDEALLVFLNSKLIGAFGVAYREGMGGIPWLLGSVELDELNLSFVKQGRKYVSKWLAKYKYLYNWTIDTHDKAHCWLSFLGFHFTQTMDVNGSRFLFFEIKEGQKYV